MKPFIGFTTDRHKTVRVPEGFFEDVLPSITSMLEMKVTLYLFWRLARTGPNASSPRMCSLDDLEADPDLRSALARCKGPRPFSDALREGIELAVARGTLLQIWVREEPTDISDGRVDQWFMLSTRDNRAWIEALSKGQINVEGTPLVTHLPDANQIRNSGALRAIEIRNRIKVIVERPSIYALYEQNIGLLTPILAERLQDAEGRYPMAWIEAAFEEAVTNNKRNWRYIERILERWAAEGKQNGKDRGPAERSLDPDKYTKGKYAFLFRPD